MDATLEKQAGRPSGGLGTFSRHGSSLLSSSKFWIINKFEIEATNIIVGNFYVKPDADFDFFLAKFQNILDEIEVSHEDDFVVLGGDFNARVGSDKALLPEIFENTNCAMHADNSDTFINSRGRPLMEFMSRNGYVLLNGRVCGDSPANWTFLNDKGTCVIDLIFVKSTHLLNVLNLKVDLVMPLSDHFPVYLSLVINPYSYTNKSRLPQLSTPEPQSKRQPIIKWNSSSPVSVNTYKNCLSPLSTYSDFPPNVHTSPNEINTHIQSAIISAATQAGMVQPPRILSGTTKPMPKKKPAWFYDTEIKDKLNETKKFSKTFKKNKHCITVKRNFDLLRKSFKTLVNYKKKIHKDM